MPDINLSGVMADHPEGNLSRKELTELPPEKLVDIIMWQRQVVDALNDRLSTSEEDRRNLQSLTNKLLLDSNTGILTMSALKVLSNVMFDSHILEILKERGYTLKMCFLDVDGLKKHNSMGGHNGGDAALEEVAKRLKILYRRKSDVIAAGLLDFLDKARHATHGNGPLEAESRYDRGDEMMAWRYAPPNENDPRRQGLSIAREVSRIKRGFSGASVSYPLIEGLTKDDIRQLDPEGQFKVESGIVTAPITVTFVCVHSPMPVSLRQGRKIMKLADEQVLLNKVRHGGKLPSSSTGVALSLSQDDIM